MIDGGVARQRGRAGGGNEGRRQGSQWRHRTAVAGAHEGRRARDAQRIAAAGTKLRVGRHRGRHARRKLLAAVQREAFQAEERRCIGRGAAASHGRSRRRRCRRRRARHAVRRSVRCQRRQQQRCGRRGAPAPRARTHADLSVGGRRPVSLCARTSRARPARTHRAARASIRSVRVARRARPGARARAVGRCALPDKRQQPTHAKPPRCHHAWRVTTGRVRMPVTDAFESAARSAPGTFGRRARRLRPFGGCCSVCSSSALSALDAQMGARAACIARRRRCATDRGAACRR